MFDTKSPKSPSSEANSCIMIIVDAFMHSVVINPLPQSHAYYACTTLYEHCISKFGLSEIYLTDNNTDFKSKEIITLCHFYNIEHKPKFSHAP